MRRLALKAVGAGYGWFYKRLKPYGLGEYSGVAFAIALTIPTLIAVYLSGLELRVAVAILLVVGLLTDRRLTPDGRPKKPTDPNV